MKKIIMITLFCVLGTASQAQMIAEMFLQKQTQKKYLFQQIAVLHAYKKSLQKGYAIAKEGLTAIGDIKDGEFTLHGDYFTSLQKPNPSIRNYTKIADIIFLQARIVQSYPMAFKQARESGAFREDEIRYIHRVYGRLLDDSNILIEELLTITTDHKLNMKDDERMKRIDALYQDMQDKYTFLKSFRDETMVLAASRVKTKSQVKTSHRLHGIKKQEL